MMAKARQSKKPRVGVVDYGMGNLRSVAKSLEAAGARVVVSDEAGVLSKSDLLVVPGVGAFGEAMAALRREKLDGFIKRWVKDGRPYLGICLGLQLLFERSDEAPGVKGLGLLRGAVKKFHPRRRALKVPHMGWNDVQWRHGAWPKASFYFVHSFYPAPQDDAVVLARTPYDGPFCSAVSQGNLLATQFHPEKSGVTGVRFLKKVLRTV